MKDMVTKKRLVSFEDDDRMKYCSAISTRSLVQNNEDQGAFTIPCTIGLLHFVKAIFELGASIYRMPPSIYKKLGLYDPKPTMMRLLMDYNCEEAHWYTTWCACESGVIYISCRFCDSWLWDWLWGSHYSRNIIPCHWRALDDMEKGQTKFRLNNEEATFNICMSMK